MVSGVATIVQDLIVARLLTLRADQVDMTYGWLRAYLAGDAVPPSGKPPIRQTRGPQAVIGLTGNIATGKSAVLNELEALGAGVLDADQLVHNLRQPGMPGYWAVVDLLGHEIVREDGHLDTAALSAKAFSSPELLRQLEQIFRPMVVAAVAEWVRNSDRQILVVEAIKLLEGDLMQMLDEVWVVDAPREEQIRRLVADRQLSMEQAQRRVDAQNPQADKLAMADVVISNAGSLDDMRWQVVAGWAGMLERLAAAGWSIDGLIRRFIDRCLVTAQVSTSTGLGEQTLRQIARDVLREGPLAVDALIERLVSHD